MPTFAYKARNEGGQPITGTLVADSDAAAARILGERDLLPTEVNEVKAEGRSLLTGKTRRVSPSKVGVMYEQLADLLRAGVPLLRSLQVLSEQAANPTLSQVLREVHDDVSGGDTLADAMDKHPHAFQSLHVSMIRAGEKGGFLEDVLARVSDFVARQDELRNKFIGSMIYPCILLSVGLGAITFVMSYVVPKIRVLLEQQALPWPSRVVFGLSDLLSEQYLEVAGTLLVFAIVLIAFMQSATGKLIWARVQLRAPGVGRIYTMVALCRFCRIFGTLLANGIPILHALSIAKDSMGNVILAKSVEKAAESVRKGDSLSGPLSASKVFPPAMIDMISVAEESNTLEKVLVQIADTQEARTARQIDLFVRLLEPLMLLLLGAMVLFIAAALLLPIMKMATSGHS